MSDRTANEYAMRERAARCTTHHQACDCREQAFAAQAAELDRLRAENEALRGVRKLPAVFDPNSGRAVVVERHDIASGSFRNVWIVDAWPNAEVTGRGPGADE